MEIAKKRMQTCCFTGHRQLPAEEQEEIASRLERVIAALYQKGIRYYGAGGALGFDALAARTVIRLRESYPDIGLCRAATSVCVPDNSAKNDKGKRQAASMTV